VSGAALAFALLHSLPTVAQVADPEPQAGSAAPEDQSGDITVTGSRISRAGFDQPTPTTVIGDTELRQGQRSNLAQALNDIPQFKPTVTPQVSVGNTSSGIAPVDLRGLGPQRTLTLLNGRRFVGTNNLNYLPMNLVDRVEVVTGGASAAYGSDAVSGVVNIILKDKLQGLSVGAISGISSRGDGRRYGGDLSFGSSFAGERGHVLFGVEYINDASIRDRNSRPNLGSSAVVRLNPTVATDLRQVLVRDVNFGNQSWSGLITSGILAGQVFNEDGTLRPFRAGTSLAANPATTRFPTQMIGGADGVGTYDDVAVTTPLERVSAFGRANYDFGATMLWAEASYGRSASSPDPFLPNIGQSATFTIQATNPFLSQTIRDQLAAAGQTSFTLGKFAGGYFGLKYSGTREQIEGAVGIDGTFGPLVFHLHYSHGEAKTRQRLRSPIIANLTNALNPVLSNGQIVCAINADAATSNDDAACRPLNLFGRNAASPEAIAYVMGTQRSDTTNKLDAVAGQVQSDLFSLWAAPIVAAVGAEARFEEQISVSGARDLAGAFGGAVGLYRVPINGAFNVKEGFGEVAVPVVNAEGRFKLDFNGAARYSHYSRSGGIWSWKAGVTVKLFEALTFRGTRSRDIRAPSITELFQVRNINVGPLADQDSAGRAAANPAYNPSPQMVTIFTGGNVGLTPEIGTTTVIGTTFSPGFLPGFDLSVDYYDIGIADAISALSGTNLTLACRNGSASACGRITRDSTGTVTTVLSNQQNIAQFQTRGVDIEAAYRFPMTRISGSIPGTLLVRALATYIRDFVFDTGVTRIDSAGDVGTGTANAIPQWRGTLSFAYQGPTVGLDARVRYVGGGKFNHLLDQSYVQAITPGSTAYLVNNDIAARTYVDMGLQIRVAERLQWSMSVNNLFDVKPPLSPVGPTYYDAIGTYFTAGIRVLF
jgi:outer membrane receptor protein involved in Fe transport